MIIRITVRNNDYRPILESFCRKITNGIVPAPPESDDGWCARYVKLQRALGNLTRPTRELSAEERTETVAAVRTCFENRVRTLDLAPETAKELIDSFECDVVDSVTEEDHAGEMFFLMPASQFGNVANF